VLIIDENASLIIIMMLWPAADAHQTAFQETDLSQALDVLCIRQQRHVVAPDGSADLHDGQRAAGDIGQRGQRLGGGETNNLRLVRREPLLSAYASIPQYFDQ
jgi:hypothetical protein